MSVIFWPFFDIFSFVSTVIRGFKYVCLKFRDFQVKFVAQNSFFLSCTSSGKYANSPNTCNPSIYGNSFTLTEYNVFLLDLLIWEFLVIYVYALKRKCALIFRHRWSTMRWGFLHCLLQLTWIRFCLQIRVKHAYISVFTLIQD